MSGPYNERKESSRAGARGYFQYEGIGYATPAEARKAAADAQLHELKSMRGSGVLHVKFGEREVWFKSDAELRDAIASLEAELNPQRPRNVVCRPSMRKGW